MFALLVSIVASRKFIHPIKDMPHPWTIKDKFTGPHIPRPHPRPHVPRHRPQVEDNGFGCDICQTLYTSAANELSEKTTAQMKKFIDQKCKSFGSFKDMCSMMLSGYADRLVQQLKDKVPASKACKSIGLC